jgi:hypothetical protein
MTAFYLKLLITPLLMLSISLAARRWGTHLAGLLSGLRMRGKGGKEMGCWPREEIEGFSLYLFFWI